MAKLFLLIWGHGEKQLSSPSACPVYANAIAGWSFGIRAAFARMKSPAPEGLTKFAIIVFLTELLLMLNGLSPSHSSLLFPPSVRSLLGRLRSHFFYFAALAPLLSIVYPRVPGQGYDEVSMAKQQTSTDLFFRWLERQKPDEIISSSVSVSGSCVIFFRDRLNRNLLSGAVLWEVDLRIRTNSQKYLFSWKFFFRKKISKWPFSSRLSFKSRFRNFILFGCLRKKTKKQDQLRSENFDVRYNDWLLLKPSNLLTCVEKVNSDPYCERGRYWYLEY